MQIPERLSATYSALGGGWPLVLCYEGTPHPQMRPKAARLGKRATVYKPDAEDQKALAMRLRTLHGGEPLEGSVCVAAVFYLPDLRTRDTDNLLKHLGDSANGVLWRDDRQVTAMAGYAELDRERPRTLVLYGADELTTVRR